MRYGLLIGLAALSVAACAGPSHEPASTSTSVTATSLIADGRTIAESECAACHAVGEIGDSPVANAWPFRTVLSRYNADVLKEELIAGMQVAHPMPNFQMNPQSADALVAYLQSIQVEAAADGG